MKGKKVETEEILEELGEIVRDVFAAFADELNTALLGALALGGDVMEAVAWGCYSGLSPMVSSVLLHKLLSMGYLQAGPDLELRLTPKGRALSRLLAEGVALEVEGQILLHELEGDFLPVEAEEEK